MSFWKERKSSQEEIFVSIVEAHKYAAYAEAQNMLHDGSVVEKAMMTTLFRMFLVGELWENLSFREGRGLILILVRRSCEELMQEGKGVQPIDMDEIVPGGWEKTEIELNYYIEPQSWDLIRKRTNDLAQRSLDIALMRYYFQLSFETIGVLLGITPQAAAYRMKTMGDVISSAIPEDNICQTEVEGWVNVSKEGRKILEGMLWDQWKGHQERLTPAHRIYLSARFETKIMRYIHSLFAGRNSLSDNFSKKWHFSKKKRIIGSLCCVGLLLVGGSYITGNQGKLQTCVLRICRFFGMNTQGLTKEELKLYQITDLPGDMVQRKDALDERQRLLVFSDGINEIVLKIQSVAFNPKDFQEENFVEEKVKINDQEATLLTGEKVNLLIWNENQVYFNLEAPLDPLELIKIAESIKKI